MLVLLLPISGIYAEIASVNIDGTIVKVMYESKDVDVKKMTSDGSETLILDVMVTDTVGTITIQLDRGFLDAKNNDEDIDYFIIFDGFSLGTYEENSNLESRTITFDIPNDVKLIEIVGTTIGTGIIKCQDDMILADGVCELEKTCGPGTILVEDTCELEKTCGPGTILVEDTCELEKTCGPGTILVEDTCELEKTCGPGTILVEDTCEIVSKTKVDIKTLGNELIFGVAVALIISIIVILIMWSIKHAHKTPQAGKI